MRTPSVFGLSPEGLLSDTTFNLGLKMFYSSIPYMIEQSVENFYEEMESEENSTLKVSVPPVPYPPGINFLQDVVTYSVHCYPSSSNCTHYVINRTEKRNIVRNVHTSTLRTCQIPVKWGQDDPYNNSCPLMNCWQQLNGRALVGCVPVAIGQLMAYHKKGPYNWQLLTETERIGTSDPIAKQNEVARLLYDIGLKVHATYGCAATSASSVAYLKSCLQSYGYAGGDYKACPRSGPYSDITYATKYPMQNSIDQGRPIPMRGENNDGAHCWINDGYYKFNHTETWTETISKSQLFPVSNGIPTVDQVTSWTLQSSTNRSSSPGEQWYSLMNWGWHGSSDGWYLYLLRDNQILFKVNMGIFPDIR